MNLWLSSNAAATFRSADALTAPAATSIEPASQTASQTASPTVSPLPVSSPLSCSSSELTSQSSPNPPPRSIKCPANDTDIFTTFTNDTANTPDRIKSQPLKYKIHCNKDYTQTGSVRDMFPVTVDSLTECINRCSLFNLQLPVENHSFSWLCSGVTLVQTTCYIKRGLTEDAISNLQHGIGDSAILIWDDDISWFMWCELIQVIVYGFSKAKC